jgi:hypothetical protein
MDDRMTTVLISIGAAILAFACGIAGLHLQRLLPDHHTSDRSRDMISAVVGLVTLLLALVLGTLIGSANRFYANQKSEIETLAARALQLDLALARFGPETQPMRTGMKDTVRRAYDCSGMRAMPIRNCSRSRQRCLPCAG